MHIIEDFRIGTALVDNKILEEEVASWNGGSHGTVRFAGWRDIQTDAEVAEEGGRSCFGQLLCDSRI